MCICKTANRDEAVVFDLKRVLNEANGERFARSNVYHRRFSETFTVREGELSIQLGKEKRKLQPGETATAPANTHHRFYNSSGKPVRFTVELRPASEGFENVLRIAFALAQEGKAGPNGMPKSPVINGILMNMGEGYFVGVFSILEKVFRFFGNSAKAKQLERELLSKYCGQDAT